MAKAKPKLGSSFKNKFNKQKKKEVELPSGGGGNLPEGIENGVAKIVDIKLGIYESGQYKDKPYFMVRGVCVEPKEVQVGKQKVKTEGVNDSMVMEPLCDTPTRSRKTESEHIDYMIGVLQEFGVDTDDIDPESIEDGTLFAAMLDDDADDLYGSFRTWKGKKSKQNPNPGVRVEFQGATDYDEDYDEEGGVEEDEEEPEADEEVEEEETEEEEADDGDDVDLDALAESADGDDEDAQQKLSDILTELGGDPESLDTWADVAEAIKEAQPDDDEEDEDEEESEDEDDEDDSEVSPQDHGVMADDGDEESIAALEALAKEADLNPDDYDTWTELGEALAAEPDDDEADEDEEEDEVEEEDDAEEVVPEKEDVVQFKPPKKRKAEDCEVTAVFARKKTVNLKSLASGTTYKSIPWDKLTYED